MLVPLHLVPVPLLALFGLLVALFVAIVVGLLWWESASDDWED